MRALLVAGVVLIGAAGAVGAQAGGTATEFPAGDCLPNEVAAGGLCWDFPPDAGLIACVEAATEGVEGREAVAVRVIVAQPAGPAALPSYPAAPVGVFATLPVGSCVGLERLP